MRTPALALLGALALAVLLALALSLGGAKVEVAGGVAASQPPPKPPPVELAESGPASARERVAVAAAPETEADPLAFLREDPPEPGKALLRVFVHEEGGAPLEGVEVLDGRGGRAPFGVTDAAGEMRRLFPQELVRYGLELVVREPGYAEERKEIGSSVSSGGIVLRTMFSLRPVGAIAGRVVQQGGLGATNTVAVVAVPDGPELAASIAGDDLLVPFREHLAWTDEGGEFRFDDLDPGVWRVAASLDGVRWGWSEAVQVHKGTEARVAEILLTEAPPRPELAGRVVDAEDRPVARARVTYSRSNGGSGTRACDGEGRFAIPGAPGEELSLRVEGSGPGLAAVETSGAVGGPPLEIVLQREPVLLVRLEMPEEVPAWHVVLRLLDREGGQLQVRRASSKEERMRWPQDAVYLETVPGERVGAARLDLPPRPTEGEQELELRVPVLD